MLRLKKVNLPLLIALIIMSLLVIAFFSVKMIAYLTDYDEYQEQATVGTVDLEIKPYFVNENNEKVYQTLDSNEDKVVNINISDYNDSSHFNKFGVDIIVYSNVETYFRIAIYEQFALTYMSGDKLTVIATTREEFMPFNYHTENSNDSFYDNRLNDGYFYYKSKVKNQSEGELIEFINITLTPFPLYEERYSILLGFTLEAVQAHLGPNYNWGLTNPPWNTGINW